VIHPLQWPGSGQTGEPRAAMLLSDGNAAINTPKGDSNDNDSSYLGAADRRVAEHGTAARREPHRVGCAGRHSLLGLGAVRVLTGSPDRPLTKCGRTRAGPFNKLHPAASAGPYVTAVTPPRQMTTA
jgi:hypothetical protein